MLRNQNVAEGEILLTAGVMIDGAISDLGAEWPGRAGIVAVRSANERMGNDAGEEV